MTHRSFGAPALVVGAVLAATLLSACASAPTSTEQAMSAVNLGIPTRDGAERTSVILHGTGTPNLLAKSKVAELTKEASDTGVPLNELFAQERGRSQFRTVMSTIGRENADILVSWGLDPTDSYDAWVLFNEEPPADVTAALGATPLDVLLEYGVNTDAVELERVTDAIHATLANVDGITLTSATWDVRQSKITVDLVVKDSSVDVESAKREALEEATEVSIDGELPGVIEFDAISADVAPTPTPVG